MKWSFPHFDYNGKMMCSMASFREHAVFGFWYASRMKDPHHVMQKKGATTAMGHFGRITRLSDLPKKSVLVAYIKEAARLNEGSAPDRPTSLRRKKTVAVPRAPASFTTALRKNSRASSAFATFPAGQKKEYIQWIIDAKGAETRDRRIRTAVSWIAEGKYRNWRYMKKP